MVAALATYLVVAMTAWVPPAQHVEGRDKALERYESIAKDIATVAMDEANDPLFAGGDGRQKTALLMASIASFESYYRADVDSGKARGDNGKSWCLMQIQVGTGKTAEGWSGEELIASRNKCLTAGLNKLRVSMAFCRALPLRFRLAGYTHGKCIEDPKSETRMGRATRWLSDHPFPSVGVVESSRGPDRGPV